MRFPMSRRLRAGVSQSPLQSNVNRDNTKDDIRMGGDRVA
jgi:hypothetical protein